MKILVRIGSRLMSFSRHAGITVALVSMAACTTTGKVTSVVVSGQQTCNASLCGSPRLNPVRIEVRGEGVCSEFKLDLGNGGFPLTEKNVDFDQGPRVFPPLYFNNGWPGPKTVTAQGVGSCGGKATTLHHVFTSENSFSEELQIGVATPNQICYAVPSAAPLPPLRKNTTVRITSPTTPVINFGCPFNGCIYDADGRAGSSASSNFAFPGLREYSLVMMAGNQIEQAGKSATFVTNQAGPLLICFNTNDIYSHITGGWQVNIFVDESQAN